MRALLGVLLVTLASGSAMGQDGVVDVTLPPGKPPVLLTVTGVGVQIYVCKQLEGGPAWSFVAPEARLLKADGTVTGSHGAGPVWMLEDGSSVRGKMVGQRASAEAGAVPWLLLEGMDAKGPGALANARWIRRSETQGGKARAEGCDASRIGETDRVAYRAAYTFFGVEGGRR